MQLAAWVFCLWLFTYAAARPAVRFGRNSPHRRCGHREPGRHLDLSTGDAARPAGHFGRHSPHKCSGYGEPGWRYGEALNPGPLRVTVNLGALQVDALLDTGSDLDAIDQDLSIFQSRLGNGAFLDRRDLEPENVGGFGVGMTSTTPP